MDSQSYTEVSPTWVTAHALRILEHIKRVREEDWAVEIEAAKRCRGLLRRVFWFLSTLTDEEFRRRIKASKWVTPDDLFWREESRLKALLKMSKLATGPILLCVDDFRTLTADCK